MFSRLIAAAGGGLVMLSATRIADVAVTLLDLGWLILSAVLHVS